MREIIRIPQEEFRNTYKEKVWNVITQRRKELYSNLLTNSPKLAMQIHDWELTNQAIQQLMSEEKLPLILMNTTD